MNTNQEFDFFLDVALIHYPVVNREGDIIGSAVTNLDLHDIARASRTFGVDTYWLVTPFPEQRELSESIISHWTDGYGRTANPLRGEALSLIKIRNDLDEVKKEIQNKWKKNPLVVATSAWNHPDTTTFLEMRSRIWHREPVLLLFGTAWGLAPEILATVDAVLPPIYGKGNYNHLSVRSAVSIILDRLLSVTESD